MKNNLFEGAKFGDKFVTRGNLLAIYVGVDQETESRLLLVPFLKKYPSFYGYNEEGIFGNGLQSERDIISRYQEPIDEKKLNELTKEYEEEITKDKVGYVEYNLDSFKAGYRKAMELNND